MRIISGTHKGRRIFPPKNLKARPTTDFAKEGLFNVLNNRLYFENLEVLDLFAGTGNISYEFASRGAARVVSIEQNFRHFEFIRKSSSEFQFSQIQVVKADVFRYVKKLTGQFDVIFADAPFDLARVAELPELLLEGELLKKEGLLIIEHSRDHDFSNHSNFDSLIKKGSVHFTFFCKKPTP